MTYIDAAAAPERNTGEIKLYGGGLRRHAPGRAPDGRGARPAGGPCPPGVTTAELDDLVFEFAMDHGAYPAPLFYRGYPKSICTSINHVVCHGIPNDKPLREGDIVNIDVTLIVDGWHGDSSRMYRWARCRGAPSG
jgi:methionyl aminopeptidase